MMGKESSRDVAIISILHRTHTHGELQMGASYPQVDDESGDDGGLLELDTVIGR